MGFTGLEMNFSDQGKREQNQNQGKIVVDMVLKML